MGVEAGTTSRDSFQRLAIREGYEDPAGIARDAEAALEFKRRYPNAKLDTDAVGWERTYARQVFKLLEVLSELSDETIAAREEKHTVPESRKVDIAVLIDEKESVEYIFDDDLDGLVEELEELAGHNDDMLSSDDDLDEPAVHVSRAGRSATASVVRVQGSFGDAVKPVYDLSMTMSEDEVAQRYPALYDAAKTKAAQATERPTIRVAPGLPRSTRDNGGSSGVSLSNAKGLEGIQIPHLNDPKPPKREQVSMSGRSLAEDEIEDAGDPRDRGLCAQTDPDAFFPEKGGSTREAKKVCLSCDVRSECLEYALAHEERFGIWGGLSERERRKLKKRAV